MKTTVTVVKRGEEVFALMHPSSLSNVLFREGDERVLDVSETGEFREIPDVLRFRARQEAQELGFSSVRNLE